MLIDVAVRATAIGAFIGLIVALDSVGIASELGSTPVSAALIGAVIVVAYVAAAWGLVLALGLIAALLERLGLPGWRLAGAPVLWVLAAGGLLHTLLNETARIHRGIEPWKLPLRWVLGTAVALLVLRGLLQPLRRRHRTLLAERGLAAVAILALLGAGLYLRTPYPTGDGAGMDATSVAPRFVREPEEALQAARRSPLLRILLLGLDGADWDRIDRGIQEGVLPSFARLVAEGIRAPLESISPTYSPRIWTTIVTGVTADEHGIRDFYLLQVPRLRIRRLHLRRNADWAEEVLDRLGELRRVPVTSSLRRRKALWNLADEAGLRAGVIGFWGTWPPERLQNGFVVSDHSSLARRYEWLHRRKLFDTHEPMTTYPSTLDSRLAPLQRTPDSVTREELAQFLPVSDGVWREFEAAPHFSKGIKLSAFRSTYLNDLFYLNAAKKLWDEERPDLLIVHAKAIDELSHFFYEASVPEAAALGWSAEGISRFGRTVDRTYAWTDRQIAPLVDAVDRDGNTLLIVVSDHGWERQPDGSYNRGYGPPGILILYGPGLCRAGGAGDTSSAAPGAGGAGSEKSHCAPPQNPSVYDITPTVLERLRLPLAEDLVGRPLVEAFAHPHPLVGVARYGNALHGARAVPSEIDRTLEEKLEALGHIE